MDLARKEIENYLIDPHVVAQALGNKAPHAETYSAALEKAVACISDYTAARTALSIVRERILLGIRDTPEDIADWVPEWAALRVEIRDFNA